MKNTKAKIHLFDEHASSLCRIACGISNIIHEEIKGWSALVFIALLLIIWVMRNHIFTTSALFSNEMNTYITDICAFIVIIILILLFIYLCSNPITAARCNKAFVRIGFTNSLDHPPILILKRSQGALYHFMFYSNGIPVDIWINKLAYIENALNLTIDQPSLSQHSQQIVEFEAYCGRYAFPDILMWSSHNQIVKNDSTLLLGENMRGTVSMSLNHNPHILIGGGTGSGKSILLKCLLMQCLHHNAIVYIADFKGGIDYNKPWHDNCTLITSEEELISILKEVSHEIEIRKKLFLFSESSNIDEYNNCHTDILSRIIIAFDEVAEALDKTGLEKDEKSQKMQIIYYLSSIARIGRAYGVHLILATQRPDANILPGQIKNNISYRICGRADNVLSQIILDNTDASTQVPSNAQGLFLNQDGILFKGYLFDEEKELS